MWLFHFCYWYFTCLLYVVSYVFFLIVKCIAAYSALEIKMIDWLRFMCNFFQSWVLWALQPLPPCWARKLLSRSAHCRESFSHQESGLTRMHAVYVCTQRLREACKSMFVIHTHRQLIMIIHWAWSEYVLLRSWGWALACFSQRFNVSFSDSLQNIMHWEHWVGQVLSS